MSSIKQNQNNNKTKASKEGWFNPEAKIFLLQKIHLAVLGK